MENYFRMGDAVESGLETHLAVSAVKTYITVLPNTHGQWCAISDCGEKSHHTHWNPYKVDMTVVSLVAPYRGRGHLFHVCRWHCDGMCSYFALTCERYRTFGTWNYPDWYATGTVTAIHDCLPLIWWYSDKAIRMQAQCMLQTVLAHAQIGPGDQCLRVPSCKTGPHCKQEACNSHSSHALEFGLYSNADSRSHSIKIEVSHSCEPNSFLARAEFAIKLKIAVLYFDWRAVHCICQWLKRKLTTSFRRDSSSRVLCKHIQQIVILVFLMYYFETGAGIA